METLCKIRDVQRAVAEFEARFVKKYGICLNEGMVLCSLHKTSLLSSGQMGEVLGLSPSNMSKVLASAEKKGLVRRVMGTKDRRQMYFSLTATGKALLASVDCAEVESPELLKDLLEKPPAID